MNEIREERLKLKSYTKANPKHPRGWIAAARLEEEAGELRAARQLIMKGCVECPKSEDMWLEASRLALPSNAKEVIESGLRHIPLSVGLWMQAASLETDAVKKNRLLIAAMKRLPNEPVLWSVASDFVKACGNATLAASLIEQGMRIWKNAFWSMKWEQNVSGAREILDKVCAAFPKCVEFLLTSARFEYEYHMPEKARALLAKAREVAPTEATWIECANIEYCANGITIAIGLLDEGLMLFPSWAELWRKRAMMEIYLDGPREGMELDPNWPYEESYVRAIGFIEQGLVHCPHSANLWTSLYDMSIFDEERGHAALVRGLEHCPRNGYLWAAAIRTTHDINVKWVIIETAHEQCGNSEPHVIEALIRTALEIHDFEEAHALCERMRTIAPDWRYTKLREIMTPDVIEALALGNWFHSLWSVIFFRGH